MSVKITWLNIACSIFGLSQRHILSTAMMEEIDRDEHNLSPTFAPARLAMNNAAGDDNTNNLGDVFISEHDANWRTPSLLEMPPQSQASAVCAWLSTLHLIVGRYSKPCSVYLSTPISLTFGNSGLILPGAIYVDAVTDFPEASMYVLVPASRREDVLKMHKHGELGLSVSGDGWSRGRWYSASSNIHVAPGSRQSDTISLAAPFGYNLIVREATDPELMDSEKLIDATISFHDPNGSVLLEKWLQ